MSELKAKYRRVLLKFSGEGLAGGAGVGINPEVIRGVAEEIREVHALGVELAIVIGGGNIIRGGTAAEQGMDRGNADSMGMLATIINAMAMQDQLENLGVPTRVMTSIEMKKVAELFIRRKAIRHLEKGRITILAGGTGNPYFSTDTGAALRANEIGADAILKATNVDGVYTADPRRDPSATKYETLTYDVALRDNLRFMDQTALALCRENDMPVVLFDMSEPGNVARVVGGETVGTYISNEEN